MAKKLYFRKLREADLEMLREWRMNESNTEFLLSDPKITAAQQTEWYKSIKDSDECQYWIINFDGVDIGYAQLEKIDQANKTADPGMAICNPEYKGRGLGKSIMANIQEYVFERMGLNKLYGPVLDGNYAALNSYMQSDWKIEGLQRQHIFKYGRFRDLYMIALLKDDWVKTKDALKNKNFIEAIFED